MTLTFDRSIIITAGLVVCSFKWNIKALRKMPVLMRFNKHTSRVVYLDVGEQTKHCGKISNILALKAHLLVLAV